MTTMFFVPVLFFATLGGCIRNPGGDPATVAAVTTAILFQSKNEDISLYIQAKNNMASARNPYDILEDVWKTSLNFKIFNIDDEETELTKNTVIIGDADFVEEVFTKLRPRIFPKHKLAIISVDPEITKLINGMNLTFGINVIYTTPFTSYDYWNIKKIEFTKDLVAIKTLVGTWTSSTGLLTRDLYPIQDVKQFTIKLINTRGSIGVTKHSRICSGWFTNEKPGVLLDYIETMITLNNFLGACYEMPPDNVKHDYEFQAQDIQIAFAEQGKIDIVFAVLAYTEERSKHLDLTEWVQLSTTHLLVVGKYPIETPLYILHILNADLWFAIVITILLMSVIRWILMFLELRQKSSSEDQRKHKIAKSHKFLMDTVGIATAKGVTHDELEAQMEVLRIVDTVLSLMYFVIIATYSGNITSHLSKPQLNKPIDSVEELLEKPWVTPMVRKGNAHYRYIKSSQTDLIKRLDKRMEETASESFSQLTHKQIATRCGSGDYCYIASMSYTSYLIGRFKDEYLHTSKTPIKWSMEVLGLPKNSPFLSIVNKGLKQMRYYGFMDYNRNLFYASAGEGKKAPSSERTVLQLKHVQSAFYIMFAGYFLSILTLIIEQIISLKKKKQKIKK